MNNAPDPRNEPLSDCRCPATQRSNPPDLISTDRLEAELFNAIMQANPGCTEEDIDNYDDSLDDPLGEWTTRRMKRNNGGRHLRCSLK